MHILKDGHITWVHKVTIDLQRQAIPSMLIIFTPFLLVLTHNIVNEKPTVSQFVVLQKSKQSFFNQPKCNSRECTIELCESRVILAKLWNKRLSRYIWSILVCF